MKPFSSAFRILEAFRWLAANASGECSVVVQYQTLGRLVYIYRPVGPLFRRLYGPVMEAPCQR